MSESAVETREVVPDWSLGWRLRRTLAHGNVTTEQIADELGVPRSAVSRWCNDHSRPSRGYLRLIAMRCGVPFDWLATGSAHRPSRGNDGGAAVGGLEGLPALLIDNQGFGWVGSVGRSRRITHVERPENQPKVSLDTVDQYTKTIRMGIPLEQRRLAR